MPPVEGTRGVTVGLPLALGMYELGPFFYELFRAEFGVSPLSYRDRLLVRRAKTMLEAGDIPVKEIALSLGFETAAYFSRFFKKQTGMTPMTYKKGTV